MLYSVNFTLLFHGHLYVECDKGNAGGAAISVLLTLIARCILRLGEQTKGPLDETKSVPNLKEYCSWKNLNKCKGSKSGEFIIALRCFIWHIYDICGLL